MTNWNIVLISYQNNQVIELTVRAAPDKQTAAVAALNMAPNQAYESFIIKPEYFH